MKYLFALIFLIPVLASAQPTKTIANVTSLVTDPTITSGPATLTLSGQLTIPVYGNGGGGGVSSLNTLTGAVTLSAGTNITFSTSGNTVTINGSGTTYIAGTGLTLTGTTFSVTGNTYAPFAGDTSITTLGTITTGTWTGAPVGASYVATLNQNTTGSSASLLNGSGGTVVSSGSGAIALQSAGSVTGYLTAAGTYTSIPIVGGVSGLGTGVANALSVNAGSSGAFYLTSNYFAEVTGTNVQIERANLNIQKYFSPWEYLAKGDSKSVYDVSATASSTTVTSATASFVAGDVGKTFVLSIGNPTAVTSGMTEATSGTITLTGGTAGIYANFYVTSATFATGIPVGCKVTSVVDSTHLVVSPVPTVNGSYNVTFCPNVLVTTIASVTNSTTAVLTSSTGIQTGTSLHAIYGTDDTTPFVNMIAAATAVPSASALLDPVEYMIAGSYQSGTNSVLQLPYATTSTTPIASIAFVGGGSPYGQYSGYFSGQVSPAGGTVIFFPNAASGSNPSLFSGSPASGSNQTNFTAFFKNITFREPLNPNVAIFYDYYGGGAEFDHCGFDVDLTNTYANRTRSNNLVSALTMPNSFNNGVEGIYNCVSNGWGCFATVFYHAIVANCYIAANRGIDVVGGGEIRLTNDGFIGCSNEAIRTGTVTSTMLMATGITIEDSSPAGNGINEVNAGYTRGSFSGADIYGSLGVVNCQGMNFTDFSANVNSGLNTRNSFSVGDTAGANIAGFVQPSLATGQVCLTALAGLDCSINTNNSLIAKFSNIGGSGSSSNQGQLYLAGQTNRLIENGSGHWFIGASGAADTGYVFDVNGSFGLTIGNTMSLKGGSNATSGTVTLSSGAATVSSTAITSSDVIVCSLKTSSGTPGTYPPLTTVSTGTITFSGLATDNSTYNWAAMHANQ